MADGLSFPSPNTLLSSPPVVQAPESSKPKNVRRQSKETKKTSLRKASHAEGSAQRPKQSKSRNGCITCKAKRLKCDEEKPGCQQCAKRKVECGGYKKDFKWRTFEETNVKQSYDRHKKATSPRAFTTSSRTTLPSLNVRDKLSDRTSRPVQSLPNEDDTRAEASQRSESACQTRLRHWSSPQDSAQSSPIEDESGQGPARIATHGSVSGSMTPSSLHMEATADPSRDVSTTITAQLGFGDPALNDSGHQDFVNFTMPEDMQLPIWLADEHEPVDPMMLGDDLLDDDVEDLIRPGFDAEGLPFFDGSPLTSGMTSPSLSYTGALGKMGPPMSNVCGQPYFAPDSIEMITARFDRMTCGILSVMDGPSENPWRTLIWPLASQSPALYHAIVSMTSFHNSIDVPALRLRGHEHKQMSLQYIREGISENSIGKQTAIATALALGFAESWDRHTDTGNTHIKGAQALVKSALEDHKRNPLQGEDLGRLKFLCNAWVYMDVIARLTAITSDDSTDFDNTFLFSRDSPRTVLGSDSPEVRGFGIDFGMPIDARLDPLMGCAGSLFPLIGRVANLVRRVCRSRTNSPAIVETAQKLQEQLQKWSPPRYIDRPEDPTTDPQHTLQTAEAYRFATLLHLHQSVPELPSPSSEDLARQVMNCLATVPMKSRTVIVQIFPLMVAGCVASQPEDREWVRKRWTDMSSRMRIGVIEKSLRVTEEVWHRKDSYESVQAGQYRLFPTADLASFRAKNDRAPRRPPDLSDNIPGRGGVVYSMVGADDDFMVAHLNGVTMPGAPRPNDHIQECIRGPMDVAYTPRGHAHWVGVMWDWGWEVLLG